MHSADLLAGTGHRRTRRCELSSKSKVMCHARHFDQGHYHKQQCSCKCIMNAPWHARIPVHFVSVGECMKLLATFMCALLELCPHSRVYRSCCVLALNGMCSQTGSRFPKKVRVHKCIGCVQLFPNSSLLTCNLFSVASGQRRTMCTYACSEGGAIDLESHFRPRSGHCLPAFSTRCNVIMLHNVVIGSNIADTG